MKLFDKIRKKECKIYRASKNGPALKLNIPFFIVKQLNLKHGDKLSFNYNIETQETTINKVNE